MNVAKSIAATCVTIVFVIILSNLMGVYFKSGFCPYGKYVPDNIQCNFSHTVNITNSQDYRCRFFHRTYGGSEIYSVCIDKDTHTVIDDSSYMCDTNIDYCESYLTFGTFILTTIVGFIGFAIELIMIIFILSLWSLPEIMPDVYGLILDTRLKKNIYFVISVVMSIILFLPSNYIFIAISENHFDPQNFKCSFYQSCLEYDKTKPNNCYKNDDMCYTREFTILQLSLVGVLLASTCFAWVFMTGVVLSIKIASKCKNNRKSNRNIQLQKYSHSEESIRQINWTQLEQGALLNDVENGRQ